MGDVCVCGVCVFQIVGEQSAVKNALAVVSSRLRESQHRDRSHFQGRIHSPEGPERSFTPADDYVPHQRRQSSERFPRGSYRNNSFSSRQSSYAGDVSPAVAAGETAQPFYTEELVFRILCPADKMVRVVGESQGILDLLQNEIGVDMRVSDPVAGSDEQIITISSEEVLFDLLQYTILCYIYGIVNLEVLFFLFLLRLLTISFFLLKKLCCTFKLGS